jgi:cytidylate kinase
MPIVTIRGQFGSGAPEIGKMLADNLHIDYVDREIIADVATKLNYPEQKIAKQEMPPTGLIKRILDAVAHSYPPVSDTAMSKMTMMYLPPSEIPLDDTSYLLSLESVIKELASANSIVIRGRGSQFILKDYPGAVHVLTVASLETRIKRIMNIMSLDEKSARQEIHRFDSSRREFIKRYFKADLEDPINYDLVINTEHIIFKDAVSLIIAALSAKKLAADS